MPFLCLGISAYHLLRHNETELFRYSFRMAAIIGVIGTIMVGVIGHTQGQEINHTQPMKLASLEALFDTENPASLSIITIKNPFNDKLLLDWRIPGGLSFMEYNRFTGEVKGINQLQALYEAQYGPGDYVPPPVVLYWSFRAMVGAGLLMILISLFALIVDLRNLYGKYPAALFSTGTLCCFANRSASTTRPTLTLARMMPSAPLVTALRIAELYTAGSPFPSTACMLHPIAFPPSTTPATSCAQAVAWLQEMTTIFFPFCGTVGVVGPRHFEGQRLAARADALACVTMSAGAAEAVGFPVPEALVALTARTVPIATIPTARNHRNCVPTLGIRTSSRR